MSHGRHTMREVASCSKLGKRVWTLRQAHHATLRCGALNLLTNYLLLAPTLCANLVLLAHYYWRVRIWVRTRVRVGVGVGVREAKGRTYEQRRGVLGAEPGQSLARVVDQWYRGGERRLETVHHARVTPGRGACL